MICTFKITENLSKKQISQENFAVDDVGSVWHTANPAVWAVVGRFFLKKQKKHNGGVNYALLLSLCHKFCVSSYDSIKLIATILTKKIK